MKLKKVPQNVQNNHSSGSAEKHIFFKKVNDSYKAEKLPVSAELYFSFLQVRKLRIK